MNERRMSDYPWTPGPWRIIKTPARDKHDGTYAVYGSGSHPLPLLSDEPYDNEAPSNMADAELIALAPEMAEVFLLLAKMAGAILADESPSEVMDGESRAYELAARLQAIIAEYGGENE